jgi:hypothetical protein
MKSKNKIELNVFNENVIFKKYKRDKIYRELLNDDIDTSFGTLQEQIIGRWETYKLGHFGDNELFEGDFGDPFK